MGMTHFPKKRHGMRHALGGMRHGRGFPALQGMTHSPKYDASMTHSETMRHALFGNDLNDLGEEHDAMTYFSLCYIHRKKTGTYPYTRTRIGAAISKNASLRHIVDGSAR